MYEIHQPPQMTVGLDGTLKQRQVELPGCFSQRIEGFRQVVGTPPPAELQSFQLVRALTEDLSSGIGSGMTGDLATLVEDPDPVRIGSDQDRLLHELRRHGVAIVIESHPRMRRGHGRHDFIGIMGQRR
jgi:hypothetical protein